MRDKTYKTDINDLNATINSIKDLTWPRYYRYDKNRLRYLNMKLDENISKLWIIGNLQDRVVQKSDMDMVEEMVNASIDIVTSAITSKQESNADKLREIMNTAVDGTFSTVIAKQNLERRYIHDIGETIMKKIGSAFEVQSDDSLTFFSKLAARSLETVEHLC